MQPRSEGACRCGQRSRHEDTARQRWAGCSYFASKTVTPSTRPWRPSPASAGSAEASPSTWAAAPAGPASSWAPTPNASDAIVPLFHALTGAHETFAVGHPVPERGGRAGAAHACCLWPGGWRHRRLHPRRARDLADRGGGAHRDHGHRRVPTARPGIGVRVAGVGVETGFRMKLRSREAVASRSLAAPDDLRDQKSPQPGAGKTKRQHHDRDSQGDRQQLQPVPVADGGRVAPPSSREGRRPLPPRPTDRRAAWARRRRPR